MEEFYAHYRETDGTYQQNRDHQKNVAALCEAYCGIPLMKKMAYVTGLMHDAGKSTREWKSYFIKSIQGKSGWGKEKEDHSTLGGEILRSYAPESRITEMAELAIFMHHGLSDCVSMADGSSLVGKRRMKYTVEQTVSLRKICEEDMGLTTEEMKTLFGQARQDMVSLVNELKKLSVDDDGRHPYGNVHFYLGMCQRLLFSVLADADVRDTVDFMENRKTEKRVTDEEMRAVWKEGLDHLERKLEELKTVKNKDSPLTLIREDISGKCEQAAYSHHNRYRLAVPTGAGKTMSALRFALRRAYETDKRHIFYVAPFRSILEQNSEEIRDALGRKEWVLEHHGDVVLEDEEERWRYERLTENWDEVPVVTTTAVQFFRTLFGEKKKNLRRFHSLCNSVIILDEVQALPVKAAGLFNLAVNFLSEMAGSTVVLCTATQPPFERVEENRMKPAANMTAPLKIYEPKFRRTVCFDCTDGGRKNMEIQEAAEFIQEKTSENRQVLAVFNTKGAAGKIYEALKGKINGKLFHLSTSMCAEHRREVLETVKTGLNNQEEIVCISTQLVEAGVDFSFRCVIRSLAGLDNLIQAAGRCNRNGKQPVGTVYIIQMDQEGENLSHLPDIRKSQESMRKILRIYRQDSQALDGRLDSEKAVQAYYNDFFYGREAEECWPVRAEGVSTDLISLLSANKVFAGNKKNLFLKQAFCTAGEKCSLIDEKGGVDVVAPYKGAAELLDQLTQTEDSEGLKQKMRMLQRYTVNLPNSLIRKMGADAIFKREDGILVLNSRYYDDAVGVKAEPGEMVFLDF